MEADSLTDEAVYTLAILAVDRPASLKNWSAMGASSSRCFFDECVSCLPHFQPHLMLSALEQAFLLLNGAELVPELEQIGCRNDGTLKSPGPLHRFPRLELVPSRLS